MPDYVEESADDSSDHIQNGVEGAVQPNWDPHYQDARRNLAALLVQQGRREESLCLWREDLLACPDTHKLLRKLLSDAMLARDLTLAGDYLAIEAELQWGGRFGPYEKGNNHLA